MIEVIKIAAMGLGLVYVFGTLFLLSRAFPDRQGMMIAFIWPVLLVLAILGASVD